MDEEFEIVIVKSVVLRVRAVSEGEAIMIAEQTLDGRREYSEYTNDGWEVDYDCEPKRTKR